MPECPICKRSFEKQEELRVHIKYFHKQVGEQCPDCGGMVAMQEGCRMCLSCGWGKCG